MKTVERIVYLHDCYNKRVTDGQIKFYSSHFVKHEGRVLDRAVEDCIASTLFRDSIFISVSQDGLSE